MSFEADWVLKTNAFPLLLVAFIYLFILVGENKHMISCVGNTRKSLSSSLRLLLFLLVVNFIIIIITSIP